MKIINLLDFLNNTKSICTLDYAMCNRKLVNFLNLILEDEQFMQRIDLGVLFVSPKTLDQVLLIDGLARVLSLSLLLHAVCECYKKTTPQNEKAIVTIRNKYLLDANKTKLNLPPADQDIYNKIIFGERLSGKEKESAMFKLLHSFWSQIKEDKLQAGKIFKSLKKVTVMVVEAEGIPHRDLYYSLNKDKRQIEQLALIESYLYDIGITSEWKSIKKIFNNDKSDLYLFFKDFFITKFNFKEYSSTRLYQIFVNYFETMLNYMSEDVLIAKIKRTAGLYNEILNVSMPNDEFKKALINIKMHKGEDTYAYLLSIYEDYIDNNISKATFMEILSTIDEYLLNRLKSPNNVGFNELIQYLNAFIICK